MGLRAPMPVPLGLLPKHASYWLCVLLFRKPLHELLSLQGDTFLRFYPVFLMYCSAMQSRCASRGEGSLQQRLCFAIPSLSPVKLSHAVQTDGRVGMLRSQLLLSDCEGSLIQRLCFAISPLSSVEVCQIVEVGRRE